MSSFEHLPPELVEHVVVNLDLHDICQLRLVNRRLYSKASQAFFASLVRRRRLMLLKPQLENFLWAMQPGRIGCYLEDLTIVGTADLDYDENHVWSEEDESQIIALLIEAFKKVSSNSHLGALHFLSLDVVIEDDNSTSREQVCDASHWGPYRRIALAVFKVTLLALCESSLLIWDLSIFESSQSYGLPCDALDQLDAHLTGLARSLVGLESLAIYLSQPLRCADEERPESELRTSSSDCSSLRGLPCLFRYASRLKSLDLYWHAFWPHDYYIAGELLLEQLTRSRLLGHLDTCRLGGLTVTSHSLLKFIQQSPITDLILMDMALSIGSFKPIFRYCTSKDAGLHHLYLADLEEASTVYFDHEDDQAVPSDIRYRMGSTTLRREGEEVQKPIQYTIELDV